LLTQYNRELRSYVLNIEIQKLVDWLASIETLPFLIFAISS